MTASVPAQRWSVVEVRLPVGGWRLGFHVQPDGRSLVEVTDPDGSLAGLVASSHQAAPSIAEAWAGHAFGLGGCRQWWALAIGHTPADGWPAVSFTRRSGRSPAGRSMTRLETVDGLWVVHDGVWVAATTGYYTHVRLTRQSATHVRSLNVVTSRQRY
jgi:hypothetical protein